MISCARRGPAPQLPPLQPPSWQEPAPAASPDRKRQPCRLHVAGTRVWHAILPSWPVLDQAPRYARRAVSRLAGATGPAPVGRRAVSPAGGSHDSGHNLGRQYLLLPHSGGPLIDGLPCSSSVHVITCCDHGGFLRFSGLQARRIHIQLAGSPAKDHYRGTCSHGIAGRHPARESAQTGR